MGFVVVGQVGVWVDRGVRGGGLGGFCDGGCGCCLVGLVGVGLVNFFFFVVGCGGSGGGCGCVCGCHGCLWIYYFIIADILFYFSRYLILL